MSEVSPSYVPRRHALTDSRRGLKLGLPKYVAVSLGCRVYDGSGDGCRSRHGACWHVGEGF